MSMIFCARAKNTWQIANTLSALMSSIKWCLSASEEKSGSRDKNQSLAKKGLFLPFFGKFTHKTLARVYNRIFGEAISGLRIS